MALRTDSRGNIYDDNPLGTRHSKSFERLDDIVRDNNFGWNHREQEILRLAGGGSTTGQAKMMVEMAMKRDAAKEEGRRFDLAKELERDKLAARGKDREHELDMLKLQGENQIAGIDAEYRGKTGLLEKELASKKEIAELELGGKKNLQDAALENELEVQRLKNAGGLAIAKSQQEAADAARQAEVQAKLEQARIEAQSRVDAAKAAADGKTAAARLKALGDLMKSMSFSTLPPEQKQSMVGSLQAMGYTPDEIADASGEQGEKKTEKKDYSEYGVDR